MDAAKIFTALLEPAGKADPYPLYAGPHRQLTRAFTHRRVAGLEPAIARPTAARGRLRDGDQPARQRIAGDPRRPGCRQAVRDRTVPPAGGRLISFQ